MSDVTTMWDLLTTVPGWEKWIARKPDRKLLPLIPEAVDRQRSWLRDAACRDTTDPVADWFAKPGSDGRRKAMEICESCPVRGQCARDAIWWEGDAVVQADRAGLFGVEPRTRRLAAMVQLAAQLGEFGPYLDPYGMMS